MPNNELRQSAAEAIAAYMYHEFSDKLKGYPVTMLPWLTDQASELMATIDGAIASSLAHPMAKEMEKFNVQ